MVPLESMRNYNSCEVQVENCVMRVTVWHLSALPSDAKQSSAGTELTADTEVHSSHDMTKCVFGSFLPG